MPSIFNSYNLKTKMTIDINLEFVYLTTYMSMVKKLINLAYIPSNILYLIEIVSKYMSRLQVLNL